MSCEAHEIDTNAVIVATQFASALNKFDPEKMVPLMHPKMLSFMHETALRLTTLATGTPELKSVLSLYGVTNIEQLREADPAAVVTAFYASAFARIHPETRAACSNFTVTVIGGLPEEDFVHVFYRTGFNMRGVSGEIPSVITLLTFGQKWRVLNTTQFEAFKKQMLQQGAPPKSEQARPR